MTSVTLIRCDRCQAEIRGGMRCIDDGGFDRHGRRPPPGARRIDLCEPCSKAFDYFMKNEDQVGEKIFKLVDAPCPHHLPCIYPCASEYKLVLR